MHVYSPPFRFEGFEHFSWYRGRFFVYFFVKRPILLTGGFFTECPCSLLLNSFLSVLCPRVLTSGPKPTDVLVFVGTVGSSER